MKISAPSLVFGSVLVWKAALFLISAQPVPANDSFFYDGAVVNYVLHGGYFNPSIARALPISGTEVFSAYPPLYQFVLLGWMRAFGVSAFAVMGFHLVLFAAYVAVLAAVFKRLQTPASAAVMAGGFLFGLTFHDRPDSLAHFLGMMAVYSWIRSGLVLDAREGAASHLRWRFAMILFVALCLATSLQIGATYFCWVTVGNIASGIRGKNKIPFAALTIMAAIPAALVALVKWHYPHLWAGFMEHARQTPTVSGWKRPDANEILKVVRTVPGIILVLLLLGWDWLSGRATANAGSNQHEYVMTGALFAAIGVLMAALFYLTANVVAIAAYLQPVIVGCYLAARKEQQPAGFRLPALKYAFLAAILLSSVRAIGMSTWGLACAADVGYPSAIRRIGDELAEMPRGSAAVLSSAYLYEAARHENIREIHSDWLLPANRERPPSDVDGLAALKPSKLILTQFDYYRRYRAVLEKAKSLPSLEDEQIVNLAKIPAPDSIDSMQRVVQHISWAPVIVTLRWKNGN